MKTIDIFCASQTATAIRHENSPSSPKSPAAVVPKSKKKLLKENSGVGKRSWKCTNSGDFITPHGSSRFLLREKDSSSGKRPEKTETPTGTEQVVMKVSLHCRGCERKLKKHLSTMEGISSYNIEFAAKKVTVTGNISPSDVLASISKVKNAQLWSPTISSPDPTDSQIKNHHKEVSA